MANFEFRSCRAKKVNFFCRGAPPVGRSKNFFDPNFFKHTQKLKFRRILNLKQQATLYVDFISNHEFRAGLPLPLG